MSQHIEIEFKNMLTEQEFTKLLEHFNVQPADFFEQENHYFDTTDFSLKRKGCALRIREKKDGYELTLKTPHHDGLLETNETLDKVKAKELLNGKPLSDGVVKEQISKLNIHTDQLRYFGSLVTKRSELDYRDGLLVLDYSTYLNVHDYEVEFEVTNREKGEADFLNLLSELAIPVRQTKNKVQRFYERKMDLDKKQTE